MMTLDEYLEMYRKNPTPAAIKGDGPSLKDYPHEELESKVIQILEAAGHAWRGHSFKNQGWAVLMVWKSYYKEHPIVVFVTDKSTTACMRNLLRKIVREEVAWSEDKYA